MGRMPDILIWQGIRAWLDKKGWTSSTLSRLTEYPEDGINRGMGGETEPLSSYFLHACVDAFGIRSSRHRSFEDTDDDLSDDECIELLMLPLIKRPQ